MAIGQRIKFFRNRKGFTQKQLGEMLGFHGKSSDVRMAQYESEARIPKQELIKEMADLLEIDTKALTVPNIDNYFGLMHTFFALEDMYGLTIGKNDGNTCLSLNPAVTEPYSALDDCLKSWLRQKKKLAQGESKVRLLKSSMMSGDINTRHWKPIRDKPKYPLSN